MLTPTLTPPGMRPASGVRRRSGPVIVETVPCDHCDGEMTIPVDATYLTVVRVRLPLGASLPTTMPCPTCRNDAGHVTGVRRKADVLAHPYIPDTVPAHWSDGPDRDDDTITTRLAARHAGKTTTEHIATLRALIAAHRATQ